MIIVVRLLCRGGELKAHILDGRADNLDFFQIIAAQPQFARQIEVVFAMQEGCLGEFGCGVEARNRF